MESIKFSIVIPVMNEGKTIAELCERLTNVMESMNERFEFVVVDDGSQDDTFQILQSLHERDERIKVIQFRKNFGKSAALAAGFQEAKGEIIVTIDADLQDVPEEIPSLMAKLEEGYDLVSSWRFDRKDRLFKRLCSQLFNRVVSFLSGVRIHDFNSGLKCYRREVMEEIKIFGGIHRYVPVLAAWRGFRIQEVKVAHCVRKHGRTKYGSERLLGGFFDFITIMMLTRYSKKPFHIFGFIGIALSLAGLSISAYLSIGWFFGKWIADRPLILLGMLLIIVGFQIIFFGLLCEIVTYSSNRYEEYSIKKRLG